MDDTAATVKALRMARGMTQEAYARHLGVSLGCLTQWEQGRRSPRGLYAKLILQESKEQQRMEHGG